MYIYYTPHEDSTKKKKKENYDAVPERLAASNISDDTCKEFLCNLFVASLLVIC